VPHIINIAAQAFIVVISPSSRTKRVDSDDGNASDNDDVPDTFGEDVAADVNSHDLDDEDIDSDPHYETSLAGDVLKKTRNLVKAIRGSGQRRTRLADVQKRFNMPVLSLLKDMTVRWSSTYLMVDRILDIYAVCSLHFCAAFLR
jgi:hypothetical protein